MAGSLENHLRTQRERNADDFLRLPGLESLKV